mgnify:CR=1 FL=1
MTDEVFSFNSFQDEIMVLVEGKMMVRLLVSSCGFNKMSYGLIFFLLQSATLYALSFPIVALDFEKEKPHAISENFSELEIQNDNSSKIYIVEGTKISGSENIVSKNIEFVKLKKKQDLKKYKTQIQAKQTDDIVENTHVKNTKKDIVKSKISENNNSKNGFISVVGEQKSTSGGNYSFKLGLSQKTNLNFFYTFEMLQYACLSYAYLPAISMPADFIRPPPTYII